MGDTFQLEQGFRIMSPAVEDGAQRVLLQLAGDDNWLEVGLSATLLSRVFVLLCVGREWRNEDTYMDDEALQVIWKNQLDASKAALRSHRHHPSQPQSLKNTLPFLQVRKCASKAFRMHTCGLQTGGWIDYLQVTDSLFFEMMIIVSRVPTAEEIAVLLACLQR